MLTDLQGRNTEEEGRAKYKKKDQQKRNAAAK